MRRCDWDLGSRGCCGRTREGIGDNIFGPWRVPEIRSKLGEVGELPLLSAGPRGRHPGHGGNQRLVVGLDVELAAF